MEGGLGAFKDHKQREGSALRWNDTALAFILYGSTYDKSIGPLPVNASDFSVWPEKLPQCCVLYLVMNMPDKQGHSCYVYRSAERVERTGWPRSATTYKAP